MDDRIQCGARVEIVTVGDSETKNGIGFGRTFRGRVAYVHPLRRWFMVTYEASGVVLRECYHPLDIGKYVRFLEVKR